MLSSEHGVAVTTVSSRQLWLPVQGLHKIKSVTALARIGVGDLQAQVWTKELMTVRICSKWETHSLLRVWPLLGLSSSRRGPYTHTHMDVLARLGGLSKKEKDTKLGGGMLGKVRWELKVRHRGSYDHICCKENFKIKVNLPIEMVLCQEAK